jgi:acyl-CoA synthetase (AMP-forming)/AMP-acid ligase II
LVASAGYFVARVTERKRLHGKTFVFLDGGLNVHNPGVGLGRFFRSNPVFLFITTAPNDNLESIDIVGNLCTSADCFGQNVEAPRLEQGDLVVIPNAGAYCQTTALWGYLDNHQELHIVGRKSVYFSICGFRVSPEYVESVAVLHEAVHDCQALNFNDSLWLNVVPIVSALSANELLSFLSERLPGYAVPQRVRFVEAIERTSSGKIRRHSAMNQLNERGGEYN